MSKIYKKKSEFLINKAKNISNEIFPSTWSDIVDKLELQDKEIFLTILKKNQTEAKGFAVIGISEMTAQIIHLSVEDFDEFESALKLVIDYIFGEKSIEQIMISIKHVEDPVTNKLKLAPEIKKIMKNLEVKWKSLENTKSGRFTHYQKQPVLANKSMISLENSGIMQQSSLATNEKKDAKKESVSKNKIYNMKVCFKLMLTISKNENLFKKNDGENLDEIFEDYQKCFNSTQFQFYGFKNFYGEKSEPFKAIKNSFDNYKKIDGCLKDVDYDKMEIKALKVDNNADLNNHYKKIFSKNIEKSLINENILSHETTLVTCINDICFKFARPVVYEMNGINYEYTRIKNNSMIVRLQTKQQDSIYLLPTLNGNLIVYYYDAKNFLKDFDKNLNLSKVDPIVFDQKLRYALQSEELCEKPLELDAVHDIWVPNFTVKGNAENLYKDFDQVIENKTNSDIKINSSYLNYQIGTKTKAKSESFKRTLKENSLVIKAPFVFGIINTLLEEKSNTPIFTVLVTQNNLNRVSE